MRNGKEGERRRCRKRSRAKIQEEEGGEREKVKKHDLDKRWVGKGEK